jgi:hypothetical protein
MIFPTNGLLSKSGFSDGDILFFDIIFSANDLDDVNEHAALVRIVKEHLVPHLHQTVELVVIDTNHNPIRARTVDGVSIDWFGENPGVHLTPETVEVPDEIVLQICRECPRESSCAT